MNKLFTKIVGVALGASMAVGVGVAVGSNREAIPVEAATNTVTFSGKDFANSSSWTYSGSTSGYDSSKGVTIYKADNGGVLTSPSFTNVTGVSVVYSSSSKGVASFSTKVGSGSAQSSGKISKSQTNTTMNLYSSSGESGALTITISCTTSTLFVKSFTVTTTGGTGYTVSFNANGGTGNMESETGISGSYTLPACGFTAPSNKDFAGWKPGNTGDTVYAAGASYTISAATEFYAQWVDHQTNRKYTVTSTSAVSESGDTMTGTSSTFLNTYTTKDQISAGNSMTLTITGMTKKVNINRLVFSMHSNTSNGSGYVTIAIDGGTAVYLSGDSSGVEFTSFGDEGTEYGTNYRDITWDDLDYTASSSIVIVIASTYKSIYCQWFDIFFSEEENTDVVTALSVNPNSWTGYDSGTIDVSDYTVTVTKGDVAGTSADYDFQGIGSGAGDNFVARIADFTSGHPTTSDTRLQWKAKYPTTVGGSTYLYTYVSLTVTADTISSIAVSGSMPTDYSLGGSWSTTGLIVTATYASGAHDTLSSDLTWNFYSDSGLTTEVATPDDLGVGNNQTIYVKATYAGVTPSKVSAGYAQVVNVTKEPGVVNFGTADGAIQMSSGTGSGSDTMDHSVSSSCNSDAYQSNSDGYATVGSNNYPLTEWTTTVDFGSGDANRVGVESFEIKFAGGSSKANATYVAYADGDENNLILSGSVSTTTLITDTTDSSYETINANSITVKFTGTAGGVKLYYFSYLLGDKVQEFGTLASIAVSASSKHETDFEIDHEFSTEGLIITATDTVGFTKDFTSGFTTDYDGVTFTEIAKNLEVTVSLKLKDVTKTTSYFINVIEIPSYSLATSQSELYEGMHVIIAYLEGDSVYTAGALSGTYLSEIDGSKDGDNIRAGDGTYEFVVEYYGSNLLLRHGTTYLKHNGDKSVSLVTKYDSACVWTYDGESLQNVSENSYYLQYNKTSPRFTDYTRSQQDVGLYISSATPKDATMGAATFAAKYLHMRDYDPELHEGVSGPGYCSDSTNHYYTTAKDFYNSASFSAEEKVEFAKLTDAVKRLQAWAEANGETFDPNAKSFNSASISLLANVVNNGATVAIIVVSAITLTSIGGYFFIRRRKKHY